MNKPIIYIAGPISGQPDLNRSAFYKAQEELNSLGFHVKNPHEFCSHIHSDNPSDPRFYRQGFSELANCTDILLLDGWQYSGGAQLESKVAVLFGMNVHYSIQEIMLKYQTSK